MWKQGKIIMVKFINNHLSWIKSPKVVLNIVFILLFAIILTAILVSKYIFIQNIVDSDNTSKVTVSAPKNIEVVDSIKTEKRRREVARKVKPILTPIDDVYIENSLSEYTDEINKILKDKTLTKKDKQRSIENLFDAAGSYVKPFAVTYFINSDTESIQTIFTLTGKTLKPVLMEGITDKDIQETVFEDIVKRNVPENVSQSQLKVITALLEQSIVPNMVVNEDATATAQKNARETVVPIKVKFNKGDIIVKSGEAVTQVKKEALSQAGYNILRINYFGILGIFSLVCMGILTVYFYLKFFESKFLNRRYIMIITTLSLILSVIAILLPPSWSVFILPFPFLAIILSVFLNPRTSYFITVTLLTVITLSLQFSALAMSVYIISVAVSTIGMNTIKYSRRFDLIKVGGFTSFSMAIIILCVYYDLRFERLMQDLTAGIFNGFFSAVVALGMIPIMENVYKIVTMFGLAELGDYNQPLLKKLHEAAPGTFEHSLRVSNLAESAAEAIGANPILARVGAL